MERKREVWLALYGVLLALLIQVFYDAAGFLGSIPKFATGLGIAALGFALLGFYATNSFNWKKDNQSNKPETQKNGDSVPSHDEIRYAMLTVFYKKAETDSHDASVGVEELIKILNVDEHIIEFNLMYLEEEKLLKHTVFLNDCPVGAMTISSAGINVIEHKEENKNRFPFLTATIPIQIQNKIALINIG